ncbi:hypothetical protein A9Q99_18300 [Gammaproteobacteria bacterium 45_16_T64]|nr:hypothetical protein A9Q99_18300 [Gammaproteobacteria bacterium 45_16_T64]
MTNNPYSSPESTLVDQSESVADIDNFKRFSAWGVLGLSIITLGVYSMYWFYTRTEIINRIQKDVIPTFVSVGALVSYVVYFGASMISEEQMEDPMLLTFVLISTLTYIVLYLWWVFAFRNRLLAVAIDNGRSDFKVGVILTFIFQAIYLQYKINEYIDQKNGA